MFGQSLDKRRLFGTAEQVAANAILVSARAIMDEYARELFDLWYGGTAAAVVVLDNPKWAAYMKADKGLDVAFSNNVLAFNGVVDPNFRYASDATFATLANNLAKACDSCAYLLDSVIHRCSSSRGAAHVAERIVRRFDAADREAFRAGNTIAPARRRLNSCRSAGWRERSLDTAIRGWRRNYNSCTRYFTKSRKKAYSSVMNEHRFGRC